MLWTWCCKTDLVNVNVEEFKRIDKTRFSKDSFIEEVPFDYLEIHVIEEEDDF